MFVNIYDLYSKGLSSVVCMHYGSIPMYTFLWIWNLKNMFNMICLAFLFLNRQTYAHVIYSINISASCQGCGAVSSAQVDAHAGLNPASWSLLYSHSIALKIKGTKPCKKKKKKDCELDFTVHVHPLFLRKSWEV